MQELIDVYFSLAMALVCGMIIRPATRNKWTPAMFAYMLWWYLGGNIFAGMMSVTIYRILWLLQFVPMSFLLSGFRIWQWRTNGAATAFLVFFFWFFISAFWGEGSVGEIVRLHFKILRMVVVGVAVGSWAISTQNGFVRLIKAVTIAAFVTALFYVRYGNWSAATMAHAQGRMVFDTSAMVGDEEQIRGVFNVNRFALLGTAMLPFPFFFMLESWRIKNENRLKWMAVVSVLVLTMVVLKTGSRNGGLGLLPLAWYFVFAKTTLKGPKKIAIMIGLSIVMLGLGVKLMQGSELRVFKFKEDVGAFEEVGTGRGRFIVNWYERMSGQQHVVGMGVPWGERLENGSRSPMNCHSMYLNIFVQSGYVGLALLCLFWMYSTIRLLRRHDRLGHIAILLVAVWFLTGSGEAANISPSAGYSKFGLGVALAFCSKKRFMVDAWTSGFRPAAFPPAPFPQRRFG